MSTRVGGVSRAPFDSFNLGFAAGDDPAAVQANRERLAEAIGAQPVFLKQVHGAGVVHLRAAQPFDQPPAADASFTTEPGIACCVLLADCMPVLIAAPEGRAVAAAHAGWRGLALGVVEAAATAVCEAASCTPADLELWLGPCIGPREFEVGADVLQAFGAEPSPRDQPRFAWAPRADGAARWRADLVGLARDRSRRFGVVRVSGGRWCTVEDRSRFFSFRRDGVTGRMAAAVCIRD
ncbi:MAG: peptidoglycan editing factor PgeF [Burkholderiaceae bacterium]